jgi:hypothetical protein
VQDCRILLRYDRYLAALSDSNLYRTTWCSLYFSERGTRGCCSWPLSSVKRLRLLSFLYERILNLNLIFAFPWIRPCGAVWRLCLLKITCTGWYSDSFPTVTFPPTSTREVEGGTALQSVFQVLSQLFCLELLTAVLMKIQVFWRLVNGYEHASCISVHTIRKTAYKTIFFSMARQPLGGLGRLIFRGFTITLFRHTTFGRTPLDGGPARRRDLYLTTHNTHKRQTSMPPVGFESTILVSERPQTHALDRTATGIGI